VHCNFFIRRGTNPIQTKREKNMIKRETDFLSILESNISILIKIARVYAYTTQDRKDLINDIILELWKSYPKFKGDSKISTWIYRVSLNVALNTKRKRDNNKVLFFDELKVSDGSDILEVPTDNSSEIGQLYQCIESLSEQNKAIILLYLDDKSYEEISQILGLSRTNVSTRLNRIKEQLRKQMNPNK
jgi:RNA polymerase sigma-70 factor (ECF subfamily)